MTPVDSTSAAAVNSAGVKSILGKMRAHGGLGYTRYAVGAIGIVAILALGLPRFSGQADALALIAVGTLGFAVVVGCFESRRGPRTWALGDGASPVSQPQDRRSWRIAFAAATIGAAVAIQMWFAPATAVAGGDNTLPNGLAWLGRVFSPWVFSGSNMGGPGLLQAQLPWGIVLWIVQSVGGSADLAQRIWYSALFIGAAVGAVALLKTLGLRPLPALCGAAAYLFNGYVLGWVGVNSTYMAALALLPALMACVLAAAKGSMRVSTAAILLAASAPILGFASGNPPLVAMVLLAVIGSPFLAGWLGGRAAARRGLLVLALGLPILLVASLYWLVPQALAYPTLVRSTLASTSAWSFTEIRATLGNALWLNTVWGWAYPTQYVPYAPDYLILPLGFAKYLLPALAFASVAFVKRGVARSRGVNRLSIAVAFGALALIFEFLSTGTNTPGSVVFNGLYSLPGGFFLREPGRFLMFAALAYSVLVGVTVDAVGDRYREAVSRSSPTVKLRSLPRAAAQFFASAGARAWQAVRRPTSARGPVLRIPLRTAPAAIALLLVAALVPAYPLMTGAIVAGQRVNLPSSHVDLPAYWQRMFDDINGDPIDGALLVLPPDDFYAMPYRFGFYGADSFVAKAIARHVILPNPQGYLQTPPELLAAVKEISHSLLTSNDVSAARTMAAMQASLVLVRGDVDPNAFLITGRHIDSPQLLSTALRASPHFALVRREGPLELYRLIDPVPAELQTGATFATVNTSSPDLSILSLLPGGTELVSEAPQEGAPSVFALPNLSLWTANPGKLAATLSVPAGWTYRLAQLGATNPGLGMSSGGSNGGDQTLKVELPIGTQNLAANGDFSAGLWQPRAGDCNALATGAKSISAQLVNGANGHPAMRLSASVDTACESTPISWKSGTLLIHLIVHHVVGASPRICLWDSNSGLCAALPPLPSGSGWLQYRAAVTPSPNATLRLFVYSDALAGDRAINDYSDVGAFELSAVPNAVVLGTPVQYGANNRLLVLHDAYSSSWSGPSGGRHVLVDGLMNGWIGGSLAPTAAYEPAPFLITATLVSAVTFTGLVLFGSLKTLAVVRRGRRRRALNMLQTGRRQERSP